MILQKIISKNSWQYVLDLHPHITVVEGLGEERRARLAAMITAVARGEMFGLEAVVDIDGNVVQFDEEIARELLLGDTNPSVVLREADLPGAIVLEEFPKPVEHDFGPPELTDDEIIASIETDLPLPVLQEPPPPAKREITTRTPAEPGKFARHNLDVVVYEEELRSVLRTSYIALERSADERDLSARAVENAEKQQHGDLPSLDEARAAVTRASAAVREAEAASFQGDSSETTIELKTQQLIEANRRRDTAKQKLQDIETGAPPSPVDISGVQRALGALIAARDAASQQTDMPSPQAQALLASLRDIEIRLHNHKPRNAPAWLVQQTNKALDEAARKLANAESEYKMASADSTDVQAVEQAHTEVLEAQEGAGKLFGGGKAKQGLESAKIKEQAALQRIGIPNYEAFRLQLGSLGRDRGVIERMLERARSEMADAEVMWDELQSPSDDVELQSLRAERDRIVRESMALVGEVPIAELSQALDQFRVGPAPLTEMEEALWNELRLVGVPRANASVDSIAESWLEERGGDSERINDYASHREEARQQAAIADAAVGELEDELANLRAQLAARPNVNDLQRAIDQAREREARAEEALRDAEYAWQVANESRTEIQSLMLSRDAAQIVYDKSRAIFLESVEQLRAEDAGDGGTEQRAYEAERARLREEYETQRRTVQAERQRRIIQMSQERDQRIEEKEAARRWDYPFFRPPIIDVNHIDPEDVEVFTLSRLSALRMVGQAGSLPIVVDDAFHGFPDHTLANMLGLLARVSRVMQIVYLSDDVRVEAWATQLGPDFARVQRFQAT